MQMKLRNILLTVVFAMTVTSCAQNHFSAVEQQSVYVETPELFSESDAFTINFAAMKPSDYSFPLPVGKATVRTDLMMEIETTKGDAVKSMFSGRVRMSRNHPSLGNVVVVRHENGLETLYALNAQNLVKVGDRVRAGQTIAIVGGEHRRTFCLFAMMVNGNRINPNIIISAASHRLLKQLVLCEKTNSWNVKVSVLRGELAQDEDLARQEALADPFAAGNKFTLKLKSLTQRDWAYPLPGGKVISPYGRRGGRSHTGTDIKTKPNDGIVAAFEGVVTYSGKYSGYGNLVRIKHPNGLETYYSHNSKNLVKQGDYVYAGQRIALTGRTGRATTEHLHFETRVAGQPFDSSKIFDHAKRQLRQETLTFTKRGAGVSIK